MRGGRGVWRKDSDWAAPVLWRSEFRNVLAGCLRKGLLTRALAIDAFARVEEAVDGREYFVDTDPVLQLVEQSNSSAYDCEFVALAKELGVPLVTSDNRILANFPQFAVAPITFTS